MKSLAVGEFEAVASGIYLEGLAVDHVRGAVWYSDVIGGGVHGVMADGTTRLLNPGRMWTGGVLMNTDGAVLSSGQGGIMWNHPDSGRSGWLIDTIGGQPVNGINEMVPDAAGGIFFGTNDIEMVIAGQPARPSSLYHLAANRMVTRLAGGFSFSNGLMFDPERRRLYLNDTFSCTYAFDVARDFTLSGQQALNDKRDADGMALDAEGNLWITGVFSDHITRMAPDGRALGPVRTPGGPVTQIRFSGTDPRDYYVTMVPADAGEKLKNGTALTEPNSILYRGRSEVPGMPVQPAGFDLG